MIDGGFVETNGGLNGIKTACARGKKFTFLSQSRRRKKRKEKKNGIRVILKETS